MTLGEGELARRSGGEVMFRAEPLRLRIVIDNVPCADEHALRLVFACSVEMLDKAIERRAFAEHFLSGTDVARGEDLQDRLRAAMREAAEAMTRRRPAADWLAEANRPALREAIRNAARNLEFDAGFSLLPPFELSAESDSLQRQRIEQMQRKVAEERAAAQLEHVQRAAELLKQFHAMRASAPELSASALLNRLSPADQSATYEAVLLAAGETAQSTLFALAGDRLARIDPRSAPIKPELIALPDHARSVQAAQLDGRGVLLIGTRGGAVMYRLDDLRIQGYAAPTASASRGFNSAAIVGELLWAAHGEIGVVAWKIGQTAAPVMSIPAARIAPAPTAPEIPAATLASMMVTRPGSGGPGSNGPRSLVALPDGTIACSAGNRLVRISADGTASIIAEQPAPIAALLCDLRRLYVIHENGLIEARDAGTLQLVIDQHVAGGIRAAGLLPWLGEHRLLIARDHGPIQCLSVDDALVSEYRSALGDHREIAAAGDCIAAVTGDRQRIVLWKPWDYRRPFGEIALGQLTRHRVADVCFV